MKTFYGFSPLSVAALLVAALVLPVILFPLGAALFTNIIFSYGYAEYKNKKTTKIFEAAFFASCLSSSIFICIVIFFPFEFWYTALRNSTLLKFGVRESIPGNTDFWIYTFNLMFALSFANLFILYFTTPSSKLFYNLQFDLIPPRWTTNVIYVILPFVIFIMILLHINYFGDYQLGRRKSESILLLDQQIEDVMRVFVTFIISCFAILRAFLMKLRK